MHYYYLDKPMALSGHNYAIIDRMLNPNIAQSWPVLSLVSPMLEHQSHLYPWLLPLEQMDPADWKILMHELEQAKHDDSPPVTCLLLKSKIHAHEIRGQLIDALYFTDEKYQSHILRYYDPRVFFHLAWMLSPHQLSQMLPLNDVSHWTLWLEGEWHTQVIPVVHSLAPGEEKVSQIKKLMRCGLINQVLDKLPHIEDMRQRQKISINIDGLIFQAMRHQLPTKEDQIAFAIQGLNLRECFWTAPKMSAFLQQAQNIPQFFHDETRRWHAAHWEAMTQR